MSNFMETNGKAQDTRMESMEMKLGKNRFRIVGSILRRYGYWVKTPGKKNVFFESLAFDRDLEKFTNVENDIVPEFFPTKEYMGKAVRNTPSWAYIATVIDRSDGKVRELHLKKTYFETIQKTARSKNPSTGKIFGDPTDYFTGYDIEIEKEKTGPSVMNVKYNVNAFSPLSFAVALTEEEIEAFEASTPIFERHPRPTEEDQRKLMASIMDGSYDAKFDKKDKDADSVVDKEAVNELN